MNWRHFLSAIVPNLLIIILSLSLADVSFGITFPNLIKEIKKESIIAQKTGSFSKNITNTQGIPSEKYEYSIKTYILLFIVYFFYITSIISFSIFIWCWITAAVIDPGLVTNDLKNRKIKVYSSDEKSYFHYLTEKKEINDNTISENDSFLKNRKDEENNNVENNYFYCDALSLIRNGQMPECLLDLPVCEICKVPRPPGAAHCSSCRCCVLRRDHHCAILGQCVGDRNIKSFFLSFIYSATFFFLHFAAALWYLIKTADRFLSITNIVIFICSVYSIVGGISLIAFDISFFYDFTKNFKIDARNSNTSATFLPLFNLKMKWRKFISTLGNNWIERLLPIHNNTTEFAWKGVHWDIESFL